MNVRIAKLTRAEWVQYSEATHLVVFNEKRPPEMERADFALVVSNADSGAFLGYVTAREIDHATVYLQHGGRFPDTSPIGAWRAYTEVLNHLRANYQRCTTLVEAANVRYLKMAMEAGFRIIGCRNWDAILLVELRLDF